MSTKRGEGHLALDHTPVTEALVEFMRQEKRWEGTATQLLRLLRAGADFGTQRQHGWPKAPHTLSGILRRLQPELMRIGIEVTFLPRKANRRLIRIERAAEDASSPSPPSQIGSDNGKKGIDDAHDARDGKKRHVVNTGIRLPILSPEEARIDKIVFFAVLNSIKSSIRKKPSDAP